MRPSSRSSRNWCGLSDSSAAASGSEYASLPFRAARWASHWANVSRRTSATRARSASGSMAKLKALAGTGDLRARSGLAIIEALAFPLRQREQTFQQRLFTDDPRQPVADFVGS